MNQKFVERMQDPTVVSDTITLGDFIAIWCNGHHRDRRRRSVQTEGAELGVYGRKPPVLCDECEAHLAYAEKRRAYCPQDPKPFCAYCETHCYKVDERAWQHDMMRYSGPRSWRKGYAIAGIKHLLEGRKHKRLAAERVAAATAVGTHDATPGVSAHATAPNNQEETR